MIADICKSVIFFVAFLISHPVNAQMQNEWTANDSVRLVKMLKGEIPVHIDDAFKKELEQSIIGHPEKDCNRFRDDFMLDVDFKEIYSNEVNIGCGAAFHNKLLDGNSKCKSIIINSRTDKNLPFINVRQSTNIALPLNRKSKFNLYGEYTQYRRNSGLIHPTAVPYSVGGGISYSIGKNMVIGTQANYQYNIIHNSWEWFCGLKFTINF